MITIPLWMRGMDAQLEAINYCGWFTSHYDGKISSRDILALGNHYAHVKTARPFSWSADPIRAVIDASLSIPMDTLLNQHNLGDATIFWWFEQTLRVPCRGMIEAQALVGHWERNVFIVTLWYRTDSGRLVPGHFLMWPENKSLSDVIESAKEVLSHEKYNKYSKDPQEQLRQSVYATETIGKFLLAAFAWLNQKILHVTEEHGERHARKRYQKVVKHWHPVLIVRLRKRDYQPDGLGGGQHASPSYRFVVNGHWRNQSCGPNHGDRKLIYIMPFVKGPEEAPFKPRLKVYEVTR